MYIPPFAFEARGGAVAVVTPSDREPNAARPMSIRAL